MTDPHPYSRLTPDVVLNALESVGLMMRRAPARAQQLREPRLPGRHRGGDRRSSRSSTGPARWSDAQILEEHAFAAELADARGPGGGAARARRAARCTPSTAFASRSSRAAAGARPSSRTARRSNGSGASSGASTPWDASRRLRASPGASTSRSSAPSRARSCSRAASFPPDLREAVDAASRTSRSSTCERCFERAGDVRDPSPARRLPRGQRAVDRRRSALRRPRRRAHGPRGAGPLDARLRGPRRRCAAQLGHILRGYEDFAEFDDRELHLFEALAHAAPAALLGVARAPLGRSRLPDRTFPFFNTPRYWQDRVLELKEQVAAMQEAPLVPA